MRPSTDKWSLIAILLATGVTLEIRAQAALDAGAILRRSCFGCHGVRKKSARLRLDLRAAAIQGGKSGPAIVAGKSGESLLIRRVLDDEDPMPPDGKGKRLTPSEVAAIRRWIDAGAKAEVLERKRTPDVSIQAFSLPPVQVTGLAVAGDPGRSRFAVTRSDRVEVWDVPETNERPSKDAPEPAPSRIAVLGGHGALVQSVAFSPDGSRLATGAFRRVRVFRTSDWSVERELDGSADRVLALAFSPDGTRLAAGGGLPAETGDVLVWNLADGELLWRVEPHTDTVLGLDWSPDGATIATGGADRLTYLLAASDGASRRRLECHTHHVLSVGFSPDGAQLATVGADESLRLWDLATYSVSRASGKHGAEATWVSFQADGKQVATTSGDGQVRFWDPRNLRVRRSFKESRAYLHAGAFFLNGTRLVAADESGEARVYDISKARLLFRLPAPDPVTP